MDLRTLRDGPAPVQPQWDCIVIGAGMSGLAAASYLATAGHRVLVVEARDRIGGRISTQTEGLPCPVDLGASFIHGIDGNPLVELARKYKLRLHPRMDGEPLAFFPDGKPMSELLTGKILANVFTTVFHWTREVSRNKLSPPTESLADVLFASTSPLFHGLETDEEKSYARQLALTFDGWIGAGTDEVSFRYWGFEREFEGEDVLVADGYVHMLEPMRTDVEQHHGEIHLGENISNITYDEDSEIVLVSTATGTSYTAQACICTLPLGVLKHDPPIFTPPLPPRRLVSIDKIGVGLLNKIVLSYPHLWWPESASVIDCFQPQDEPPPVPVPDILARRSLLFQSYQPVSGHPVLLLFLGAHAGEALETLTDDQARDWAHGVLTRAFLSLPGSPASAPAPVSCHVTRWRSDPYARGSYSYVPVSTPSAEGDPATPLDMVELSRPLWDGRLGFAGEHTEMDHFASVHGALLSGWRDAKRVKAALEGSWAKFAKDVNAE